MSKPILFIISKGHGNGEPGAVDGKFVEVEMTTKVADACYKSLLATKNRKFKVLFNEKNTGKSLYQHFKEIMYYRLRYRTVFVDIHFNAGKGDGAEVWVQPTPKLLKELGTELGNNILKEFKKLGQNSRGIKTGDLYVTNIKKGVNIIVEVGFLDNKTDRKAFDTDKELAEFGKAIANACKTYAKKRG